MSTKVTEAKLDELFSTKRRWCYYISESDFIKGHGYRVSIVCEDEPARFLTGDWPCEPEKGHKMPWFWGDDLEEARAICAQENMRKLGLSEKDAAIIVARSMAMGLKKAERA